MRILSVIQPSELGADFRLDEGVWKVNFPTSGNGSGNELSTDENNAIVVGTDQGLYLDQDLVNAYTMLQDNGSKKIHLYRFPAGTVFDIATATLVSSVSLIEMSGIFDDVAIDGQLITFTDADTGLTLTIDTAALQRVDDIIGSDSIMVTSLNGVTTLSVRIDPNPDNAIEVTEEGLLVNIPEQNGELNTKQSLSTVETGLCHVVGNSHLVVPHVEITDINGVAIGYVMGELPQQGVHSITAGPEHCVDWIPPMEPPANCRVGKVGNGFPGDWPYLDGIDWKILIDGVDTGYTASMNGGEGSDPKVNYLEEILSAASNNVLGVDHTNYGLGMWNKVNRQVILSLVPNAVVTIDMLNEQDDAERLKTPIFDFTKADVVTYKDVPDQISIGTAAAWEDYFVVDDAQVAFHGVEGAGIVHICFAPNSETGGGPEVPGGNTISCADATDRFAIQGFWGNWEVKVNGVLIPGTLYSEIIPELESRGIHVGYQGETFTGFRNLTNSNIRLEFIGQMDQWGSRSTLRVISGINPTAIPNDPEPKDAPMMMAMSDDHVDDPNFYRGLTVCLTGAGEYSIYPTYESTLQGGQVVINNSVMRPDFVYSVVKNSENDPIEIQQGDDQWGDKVYNVIGTTPGIYMLDVKASESFWDVEAKIRTPIVLSLLPATEYENAFNVDGGTGREGIYISKITYKQGGITKTLAGEITDGTVIETTHGALRIDSVTDCDVAYVLKAFQQYGNVEEELIFEISIADEVVTTVNKTVGVGADVGDWNELFVRSNPEERDQLTIAFSGKQSNSEVRIEWESNYDEFINAKQVNYRESYTYNNLQGGDAIQNVIIHGEIAADTLAIFGDCLVAVHDLGDSDCQHYCFNPETWFSGGNLDFSTITPNNIKTLPETLPLSVNNLCGTFAGIAKCEQDLNKYNLEFVNNINGIFAHSGFNGNVSDWWTGNVYEMTRAFYASKFKGDTSMWCVGNITEEPKDFSKRSPLPNANKPTWGTCPAKGGGKLSLRMHKIAGESTTESQAGTYIFKANGLTTSMIQVKQVTNIPVDVVISDMGYDYSISSAIVGVTITGTSGAEGLIHITHPKLKQIEITNLNQPNPNQIDIVAFSKNVEHFLVRLPYDFKVPNNIPSTLIKAKSMFEDCSGFTGGVELESWDTGMIFYADSMMKSCSSLTANLSKWCTEKLITAPIDFAKDTPLTPEQLPVWGTCPFGSLNIDTSPEPDVNNISVNYVGFTTEEMPTYTGRVSSPLPRIKIYDDNKVKYVDGINNGDGTWSCTMDYVKDPDNNRLSVETQKSTETGTSSNAMALIYSAYAEIEGGYYDSSTAELVCTSADGLFLRTRNDRDREVKFKISELSKAGVLAKLSFGIMDVSKTLADVIADDGQHIGMPFFGLRADGETYGVTSGDRVSYSSWTPTETNSLTMELDSGYLVMHSDSNGWDRMPNVLGTADAVLCICLKPAEGQSEARVKIELIEA